ncbi:probable leucine-rich repeat receptor-like protein kinase At1g35710 [Cynara cardunculus var. scolymus]|uniref:probable leucine-rich repeat receptor-like protein kinase At1g35710 n=1 Tax=Cynara cardunculus var. scolymus TaxID=59895 RepID=UPI000D625490|nr:probable leucine-rich repeat receptor-like protein kinase At1g35710 [Cynara cardunculus var. scolymus]
MLSFIFFLLILPISSHGNAELAVLMDIKASLDPENKHLSSWTETADPCGGSFIGVACNQYLKVANISLQGKGLTGKVPPAISGLKCLSGLYLHYNFLTGEIPKEISTLTELSELYLNVNNLTGIIPQEIGNMANLEVIELCCNQLNGSIPSELGTLKKLHVLALQHNRLTGQIPRTLGGLVMLKRLDLSYNQLDGPIPITMVKVSGLEFLDVQNNTLSGFVPTGLKRLNNGFSFKNNRDLCGAAAFGSLRPCTELDVAMINQLEPFTPTPNTTISENIPQSANILPRCQQPHCTNSSNLPRVGIIAGIVAVIAALTITAFITVFIHRRRKQKIWSKTETPEHRFSMQESAKKSGDSACAWDPTQKSPKKCGFCIESRSIESLSLQSFNLEEIESATRYFSDANLLGRSKFSAVYKGVLRDRSVVAIKSVSVTSCKADEAEFTKGLSMLTSLKHENLARLRGFCCSKGRGECFLVYDFASKGNLSEYLDIEDGRSSHVLDWPKRVTIINGIAKGLAYLHRSDMEKSGMVHRNISMEKILLDQQYNPLITDAGLLKLLADDIVFSALKVSAALGYMAPEYITTGKFTEKSDVYAFGVVVLQILSGKSNITGSIRAAAADSRFGDFIDENLEGNFSESEADKLAKIGAICVDEVPENRLTMEAVILELTNSI